MCNSHLGLYTNLDPQKHCIRTALSASPMSISACHLGHFFAILKTQVSEKLGPSLPSVSSHRIGFPVVHFTQFVIYRMALDDDSTQRTRTVRECCGSGWGRTTACNSAQFRPCFAPNWVLLVAHFRKQHTSDRALHKKSSMGGATNGAAEQ